MVNTVYFVEIDFLGSGCGVQRGERISIEEIKWRYSIVLGVVDEIKY